MWSRRGEGGRTRSVTSPRGQRGNSVVGPGAGRVCGTSWLRGVSSRSAPFFSYPPPSCSGISDPSGLRSCPYLPVAFQTHSQIFAAHWGLLTGKLASRGHLYLNRNLSSELDGCCPDGQRGHQAPAKTVSDPGPLADPEICTCQSTHLRLHPTWV